MRDGEDRIELRRPTVVEVAIVVLLPLAVAGLAVAAWLAGR